MKGYCISEKDGYPVFDPDLCNICQKCVSICLSMAIMVNGHNPERISETSICSPAELRSLFERRRSIKHFIDKRVPREILQEIVSIAGYAPNQNKNISVHVVDDANLLQAIDDSAVSFVKALYRFLFVFNPAAPLLMIVSREFKTIKRKMEYDLVTREKVMKDNTQALIILTGRKSVPVTESSAHYMLASVMYMAETSGIGTCLMDSFVLSLNANPGIRKVLGIRHSVLGVLALGYSSEQILNIPRGYQPDIKWNGG
jgi:nitroreductase